MERECRGWRRIEEMEEREEGREEEKKTERRLEKGGEEKEIYILRVEGRR